MADKLRAAGAPDVGIDPTGNVVARFGPAAGPAAIVAAHLDTVFGPEVDVTPTRDGDTLRGPGIGDDALALAALVHVARRLAVRPPRHPLVVAATVGEEGLGDLCGARALLEAVACDAFVALEGHGIEAMQTAGIASVRLVARATGPGGHSWGDRGRASAVHDLVGALQAGLEAAAGGHVNVGVVRGGTSINTIAAAAEAEIDLRDADDETLERRVRAVEEALRAHGVATERVGQRPGGVTAPDHPLVRAARQARRDAGLPQADEHASSTDANAALGRGIPAICISLTQGAGAHTPDEHVQVRPLSGGLAALDGLVHRLAAGLSA